MKFIGSEYKHYETLVQQVGEDKIRDRYQFIYEAISQFIVSLNDPQIEQKLQINERALMHSVLEYFEDIWKVKNAHELDHANTPKVYAYIAYWFLRRHPIQVLAADPEDDDLIFINEKFILSLLMSFLTHGSEAKPLVKSDLSAYIAFANSFYYYLKFRRLDPQSIEMILLSFRLGGVFPECKDMG